MSYSLPPLSAITHLNAPPCHSPDGSQDTLSSNFLFPDGPLPPSFSSPQTLFSEIEVLPFSSSSGCRHASSIDSPAFAFDIPSLEDFQIFEELEFPLSADSPSHSSFQEVNPLKSIAVMPSHSAPTPTLATEAEPDLWGCRASDFVVTDIEPWTEELCTTGVANASRKPTPKTRSIKQKQPFKGAIPDNVKVSTRDKSMFDGYRWKKYGKRAIKVSPHPRLYFKCAARDCSVTKQVEHSPEDPSLVVTTYNGTHNHDPPALPAIAVKLSDEGSYVNSASHDPPALPAIALKLSDGRSYVSSASHVCVTASTDEAPTETQSNHSVLIRSGSHVKQNVIYSNFVAQASAFKRPKMILPSSSPT